MNTIVLLSCTSKKNNISCNAKDMYMPSVRFRLSYNYAKKVVKADKIFILSAKYGLLEENELISPYNKTLKNMKKDECMLWADNVYNRLKNLSDVNSDNFVILAGKPYYKYILPKIKNYDLPLKNMPIGKGNSFLKQEITNNEN